MVHRIVVMFRFSQLNNMSGASSYMDGDTDSFLDTHHGDPRSKWEGMREDEKTAMKRDMAEKHY